MLFVDLVGRQTSVKTTYKTFAVYVRSGHIISKTIEFHKKKKNDITLVASSKNYQIPYGVCNVDNQNNLKFISEKPKLDFLANTGLYLSLIHI